MAKARRRAKVVLLIGTRPEAVKMAPVHMALKAVRGLETVLLSTGQHRELLDQTLVDLDLAADHDLDVMRPDQSLSGLTALLVERIAARLEVERPGLLLVQGDTTSAFCGALAAYYAKVPVGHVEAGLRSYDKRSPYPEEMNRVLSDRLADMHFAPTEAARQNLIAEGISEAGVFVTGNTVVDAVREMAARVSRDGPTDPALARLVDPTHRLIVLTSHRRENFGEPLRMICRAVQRIARDAPHSVRVVYPVHLNPRVRAPVRELLGAVPNVHLLDPLGYRDFVWLMNESDVLLTDSGGLQEEGAALGKPVLILRENTERPEGIQAGTARLLGVDEEGIVAGVFRLLGSPEDHAQMSTAPNPFGDGRAGARIAEHAARFLGVGP